MADSHTTTVWRIVFAFLGWALAFSAGYFLHQRPTPYFRGIVLFPGCGYAAGYTITAQRQEDLRRLFEHCKGDYK